MARWDPSVTELGDGVTDGHGEQIHIGDHADKLAAIGVAFPLPGSGVSVTPGLIFEGDLLALQAGGQDIGTESYLGVLYGGTWAAPFKKAGNEKPAGAGRESLYFHFIGSGEIVGQQ